MKRIESDLIGSMEVPSEALYGVQTLRGIENFPISCFHLSDYPLFINGLALTKLAAAMANHELGLLTDAQYNAICQACREILDGKYHDQFPGRCRCFRRIHGQPDADPPANALRGH